MDLIKMINSAKTSSFGLWKLNAVLYWGIPFNAPHNIRIVKVNETGVKTKFPYIRQNFNHLKGLHACGLAAQSEFTAGITLMSRIDAKKYRLIMKTLTMEYFYQGKSAAYAEFALSDEWINENVVNKLQDSEITYVDCAVKVMDSEGNHLCTGTSHWQLKRWDKVKTKV